MSDAIKAENGTLERELSARIKLHYDLHLPKASPAPLLIVLHGYGANKRQMMREAKQFAPANFAIASLQGFHQHLKEPREPGGPLRFGFGWLTNFHPEDSIAIHHQALRDLINTLIAEGVAEPDRVFLLGFSQSCALNYRFAFTYPDQLRGVIGICGGLPGDWETSEAYQKTDATVLHLAGVNDEFYSPSQTAGYRETLLRRAKSVSFESFEAGHEIVPAMRAYLRTWLENYRYFTGTQSGN
jgi:phospholipase/carboxylesterase